jgi:hypothetical protein
VKDTELIRARFKRKTREFYQIMTNDWPKLHCHIKSTDRFLFFLKHLLVSIHSYHGPDAIVLNTANDVIASTFIILKTKKVGVVVLGRDSHFYMMRFEVCMNLLRLNDIYELDYRFGLVMLEKSTIPHSSVWKMCEVCCKKAKTHCNNCSTIYCSKECQVHDWIHHKKYCGQKNMHNIVDIDECKCCIDYL